jgi:hypothetical protein
MEDTPYLFNYQQENEPKVLATPETAGDDWHRMTGKENHSILWDFETNSNTKLYLFLLGLSSLIYKSIFFYSLHCSFFHDQELL